jgi:hypothetical protein
MTKILAALGAKLPWLGDRLAERSTWQGAVAVASALGVALSPDRAAAIVTAGVAVGGLIHVLFPESGKLGS